VNATTVLAMLCVGGGLALLATGTLARARSREMALADILDLPYGERDVPVAQVVEQHGTLVENTISLTGKMVEQVDPRGGLGNRLQRARLPIRTGEFVLIVAASALTVGLILAAVTAQWVVGLVALLAAPFAARLFLNLRISRRIKRFEAQFPDALMLIASSLAAGHTFLRAIQIMTDEAQPPISEEFGRVIAETELGAPLIEALDRMAQRLDVRDVDWVVQAIRIQQTVGGKLAELLTTLADFIRAREEVRREIDVLTAEGRISAWVLGALPLFLFIAVQVIQPGYMDPLLRGWGWVVLGATALSMGIGVLIILRMVKGVTV